MVIVQNKPGEDVVKAKLLEDIEKFLKRTGMSARGFSEALGASNRFVARLRQGTAPSSAKISDCYEFMRTYRKGRK